MQIIYNEPQIKLQINSGEPWLNGETDLATYVKNKYSPNVVFAVGAQKDFDFCRVFESKTEIHLFDPQKKAFRELMNDEYLFNRPNTYFNLMGLSNVKGRAVYFIRGESVYDHDGKNETDVIFLSTIKDYCEERGIEKIDFLKIDVEGLEWEVINGAADFINKIDFIQFEYGDRYPKAGKTLKMMFDLMPDRWIYHIEPGVLRHCPSPIENYHYANYLASKIQLTNS